MNSLFSRAAVAGLLMGASVFASAADALKSQEPPKDAKVVIVSPADGATVDKTFTVKFGIEGMELKPAGDQTPHSGHHHLLVDVDKEPVADMPLPTSLMPENNAPLPAGPQVLHFGKAQTEATITLTPGKHTLQLVLGDKYHVPFKPSVESKKITVEVK
ncbi:DUF4399 domain-containing protein [Pseudomonas kermanshahensis]|jgi:hypothetical protein|uniref:DUF4399 domain-containing protein n=1 Tax=Pseudomonas kermanshahensis TaxID=2745482 RepID=A0ABU8R8A7_9PSED|nr:MULTISPECIES: DUF4399 domain-containing protein [Pseudomonas]ATP47364.1 ATPase [Pseudomonas putida]MBC3488833.1 DUF4399 domain-containing protein [Pseudomonas sp. SWRI50]USS55823.1 DUF4399 domain-containing protein [Pseudomonas kermanshahensis]UVL66705.1 DUF4399 domain-containing protein [Pseudomonas sp. B21-031]GLO55961.1 rod shape-determining protein RodA [Pseudomonas putida]